MARVAFPEVRRLMSDQSEGYEDVAYQFMTARSDIGATFVRSWARDNLPPSSSIADVGCGSGVPIAQALIEDGFTVFGIDASPSLLAAFRRRFPDAQSACEAAQDSVFFHHIFDAAVSVGLLFLLSADDQRKVFQRVANALRPGVRFLFTAPWQICEWQDLLTKRQYTCTPTTGRAWSGCAATGREVPWRWSASRRRRTAASPTA